MTNMLPPTSPCCKTIPTQSSSSTTVNVATPIATGTSLGSYGQEDGNGLSLASSTETYIDPNGAFSVGYITGYSIVPSASNSSGYHCSSTKCPFNEDVIGIQPPGHDQFGWTTDNFLGYITIDYGSSTNEVVCDQPNNNQPGDGASAVIPYTFNNIQWYWSRLYSSTDQYQTYRNGACWGVEFDWGDYNNEPLNDALILPFEKAVMTTFQFLNSTTQPYYIPYTND